MLNRNLIVGAILGAGAAVLVMTFRTGGPPVPQASAAGHQRSCEDDGSVELRFRLPRSASPGAPTPSHAAKQGALVNTGQPLDLAIEGAGYFQVTIPNGELRYTRRGNFSLNAQGNLVTADGFLVSPQISVPPTALAVSIAADGTIAVTNAGSTNTATVIGQFVLTRFVNPDGLAKDSDGYFAETTGSGCPVMSTPGQGGLGLVRQGYQEQHRDDMVRHLIGVLTQLAEEEGPTRVRVRQDR